MNQLKKNQNKIKLIKYIFLSSGIFLLLAILFTILYSPSSSINKSDTTHAEKSPIAKDYSLSIQQPVFEGLSNNLIPYTILANAMIKDKNNTYILETVAGKYFSNEGEVTINSNNAILDEITKHITLTDNVLIIFNGVQLKSSQLNLNINTQNIKSESSVLVNFSNSYIKADKLESEDYSEKILFKGNVNSVFDINDF